MRKSLTHFIKPKIAVAVACTIMVNGCAIDPKTGQPSFNETFNSSDPCANNARNIGILAGGVLGAVVGHKVDKKAGLLVGTGVGALIGGLVGNEMDRRKCELSKVAKQYNIDLKVQAVDSQGMITGDGEYIDSVKGDPIGSVLTIADKGGDRGHFQHNSDRLTNVAKEYFAAIAQTYNLKKQSDASQDKATKDEYLKLGAKRKLLLVGHTDDTGATQVNADLSERRAKAVAKYLTDLGIPKESIYFQGAGESYPIATNNTDEGRMRNRRVELVEMADEKNFKKFLDARTPKYEYYRTAEAPSPKAQSISKPSTPSTRPVARAKSVPNDSPVKNDFPNIAKRTADAPRPVAAAESPKVQQAGTAKAATKVATAATVSRKGTEIDFGGVPFNQAVAVADVGKIESKRQWISLISTAHATEPAVLRDCSLDRPRAAGAVKSLSTNKPYTNDYMDGLHGKTWTDNVNGHQIVLNKVSVLRSDATVSQLPDFKVYKNYNPSANRNPRPDVETIPQVNTYRGSNGLLYRVFLEGNAGLNCADILFNNSGVAAAKAGKILYASNGQTYVADFKPAIHK